MLHLVGDHAAVVGGMLVGLLSLLAIPACFALLRTVGLEREAAFHGASYLALCPGLIVVFPQFDPLTPRSPPSSSRSGRPPSTAVIPNMGSHPVRESTSRSDCTHGNARSPS
jgi:hypothetical protein